MTVAVGRPSAAEALQRLREVRAVAVVRARDADEAIAIAQALARGGLHAIELTCTTPGVAEALAEARRHLEAKALLGVGTITTKEQLGAALEAEADFLVSPHVDPVLLDAMLASGRLTLPGVLTPSEVAAALRAGASAVKLFPASTVGVGHLRALLAPFPELQAVPTGGVTIATAREWLDAGAAAVGLGAELMPKKLRDAGAWEEISRNSSLLLDRLRDKVAAA
jgi:2-dehydro-3-deoxyphosphogluconate aldolase / (4S)-4-hydroxy-2-oxoglutarate aldolase